MKVGMKTAAIACLAVTIFLAGSGFFVFYVIAPLFGDQEEAWNNDLNDVYDHKRDEEESLSNLFLREIQSDARMTQEAHVMVGMVNTHFTAMKLAVADLMPTTHKSTMLNRLEASRSDITAPIVALVSSLDEHRLHMEYEERKVRDDMFERSREDSRRAKSRGRKQRHEEAKKLYGELIQELSAAKEDILSMKRYWCNLKPKANAKLVNLHDHMKLMREKTTDQERPNTKEWQEYVYDGIKEIEKTGGRRLAYGTDSAGKNNGLALVPRIDALGGAESAEYWLESVLHLSHAGQIYAQVEAVIDDLQLWHRVVQEQDPSIANKVLKDDPARRKRYKGSPIKVQAMIWGAKEGDWFDPLKGIDSFGKAYSWFSETSGSPLFHEKWVPATAGGQPGFFPKKYDPNNPDH
jgi:hypothetical protein